MTPPRPVSPSTSGRCNYLSAFTLAQGAGLSKMLFRRRRHTTTSDVFGGNACSGLKRTSGLDLDTYETRLTAAAASMYIEGHVSRAGGGGDLSQRCVLHRSASNSMVLVWSLPGR